MPFSDKEKPDSGAVSCIITYCDSISEDTIPASSEPGISTTENYKTLTRDINDTLTSVKYLFLEELEVFYQR